MNIITDWIFPLWLMVGVIIAFLTLAPLIEGDIKHVGTWICLALFWPLFVIAFAPKVVVWLWTNVHCPNVSGGFIQEIKDWLT